MALAGQLKTFPNFIPYLSSIVGSFYEAMRP
jgi:hypothetical protein